MKHFDQDNSFRFLAAQMIYVAAFVLFLQLVKLLNQSFLLMTDLFDEFKVLVSTDIHDGHPSATNPHTYVKFFGVISCSPFMSGKAKGFLIFSCIVLVQTLFFGLVQFLYYYRYNFRTITRCK